MSIRRVSFIHIRDRKLLVALNKGKANWYTPGGSVEVGEADKDALCRELDEELGIDMPADSLRLYKTFTGIADEKAKTPLTIISYFGELTQIPTAQSEIKRLSYFSSAEKHLLSPVAQKLFASLHQDGLVD